MKRFLLFVAALCAVLMFAQPATAVDCDIGTIRANADAPWVVERCYGADIRTDAIGSPGLLWGQWTTCSGRQIAANIANAGFSSYKGYGGSVVSCVYPEIALIAAMEQAAASLGDVLSLTDKMRARGVGPLEGDNLDVDGLLVAVENLDYNHRLLTSTSAFAKAYAPRRQPKPLPLDD